jgi:signal transduction histidine kinase
MKGKKAPKSKSRAPRPARRKKASAPAGAPTALLEQVRAGRERSQRLARQLLLAQEGERRRLARELHDEIGQALTAVKLNLEALGRTLDSTPTEPLKDSLALVEHALQQVRGMSLDLRPSMLDDLGLAAALRWHLDRQAQRGGLTLEFSASPVDLRVPTLLEITCFRVAQEAMTNVLRHAGARSVRVRIWLEQDALQLRMHDDGAGFDIAAARRRAAEGGSLGLLGMQERVVLVGGKLDITSTAGAGTVLHVRLPVSERPVVERRSARRAPA